MSRLDDILFGSACLPAHDHGGWALPGGKRVTDKQQALEVAKRLSYLIGERAPTTSRNPPVVLKRGRGGRLPG